MNISDTQLAAALMSMGYELLPTEFNTPNAIVFQFGDAWEVVLRQQQWRDMARNAQVNGNTPLEIMFRVSRAREWMLKQVVHGNHNEGLTLPVDVFHTPDLHVAVSLVAKGCYLLKLDKRSRMFYFSPVALPEYDAYKLPSEWYRHARDYLHILDELVRRIHNRNLTRQGNADAITSKQIITKSDKRNSEPCQKC